MSAGSWAALVSIAVPGLCQHRRDCPQAMCCPPVYPPPWWPWGALSQEQGTGIQLKWLNPCNALPGAGGVGAEQMKRLPLARASPSCCPLHASCCLAHSPARHVE